MNRETHLFSPKQEKLVPWIIKVSHEDAFFKNTDFSQESISLTASLSQFKAWLKTFSKEAHLNLGELDAFFTILPQEIPLRFFENSTHMENFVVLAASDHQNSTFPLPRLFIRYFFYRTLFGCLKRELGSFLLFHYLLEISSAENFANHPFRHIITTITKEITRLSSIFLSTRENILEQADEYESMYARANENFHSFILSLTFAALLETKGISSCLIELEKKQLSEYIFARKLKQSLKIDEKSYQYIEQNSLLSEGSLAQQDRYHALKEAFAAQAQSISEFTQRHLQQTQLLFWCSWTISPFLASDIKNFLKALLQEKNITQIYIDLPVECNEPIHSYLHGSRSPPPRSHYGEDAFTQKLCPKSMMREHIEQIYPIFIPEYAKETLPYMVFCETLRDIDFPKERVECIGFDGDELMMQKPVEEKGHLVFPVNPLWQKKVDTSLRALPSLQSDDIILFFYFLKPMYSLRQEVQQHPAITKILHTDMFTGFGPKAPINSLAHYSQHSGQNSKSFAFTNIQSSPLANENIIFYPSPVQDSPLKLDESTFNTFKIYDTLLYSGMKNGGDKQNEPNIPQHDYSFTF